MIKRSNSIVGLFFHFSLNDRIVYEKVFVELDNNLNSYSDSELIETKLEKLSTG